MTEDAKIAISAVVFALFTAAAFVYGLDVIFHQVSKDVVDNGVILGVGCGVILMVPGVYLGVELFVMLVHGIVWLLMGRK